MWGSNMRQTERGNVENNLYYGFSGKEWARQSNRLVWILPADSGAKVLSLIVWCLVLGWLGKSMNVTAPERRWLGCELCIGWLAQKRCAHRWVVYYLWELANSGMHSPSRVRKAPDVKASEIQKIKRHDEYIHKWFGGVESAILVSQGLIENWSLYTLSL